MKNFNKVSITRKDNCISYAVKRVGYNFPIESLQEITKYFTTEKVTDDTKFIVGDIVFWNKSAGMMSVPTIINEDKTIETTECITNAHVAVIETIDLRTTISYCTRKQFSGLPSLHIIFLDQKRIPDFILRPLTT